MKISNQRALTLFMLGGVWMLGFVSGVFGTLSSTLLSGHTCSAYGYFIGFGYGYDCTANPAVTITWGSLGMVSAISGTTTAADSVTIGSGTNVVFNPLGNVKVTIPSSTVITPVGASTFDTTAMALNSASVTTGLGTNEEPAWAIDFWVGGWVGLKFSIPVRLDIPVPGYTNPTISVKVRHAWSSIFTTDGLTNDPNTTCTNWVPGVASSLATVSASIATIYTCQASTFTTYKVVPVTIWGGGGGGGGWSSYSPSLPVLTSVLIPVTTQTDTPINLTSAPTITSRLKALQERLKKLREGKQKKSNLQKSNETSTGASVIKKNTVLYVNVSKLSVRQEPDTTSKVLWYLTLNARVTVLEERDWWVKLHFLNKSAWAQRESFSTSWAIVSPEVTSLSDQTQYQAQVNVAKLSIWSSPSEKNSKFIWYLYRNQKVTVTQVEGSWAKVETSYFSGWVIVSRIIKS